MNYSAEVPQDSALTVHKLTFWEAAMMVVGANIGSGVLGLAYSVRKSGWPIMLLWLVIVGLFSTFSTLYVAEATLRTRRPLQLPGLAERYVGKHGGTLMFAALLANAVGCMTSYMMGSGNTLATLLGVPHYVGSLLFVVPAVLVVWCGLKAMGIAQKYSGFAMMAIVAVVVVSSFSSGNANIARALYADWSCAMPVFSVVVFCYIAQYAVPEMARGLRHDPLELAPAIIMGMFLSGVLLAVIPLSVLALTGPAKVTQLATIAWADALGRWAAFTANLFALIAMLTSYWAIGGSLLTAIVDMFKLKSESHFPTRLAVIICVWVPPFILAYSGLIGFIDVIYWAGIFGGVVMSILSVLILRGARRSGDMLPDWKCGWYSAAWVQDMLIVMFVCAGLYAILDLLGVLPGAW